MNPQTLALTFSSVAVLFMISLPTAYGQAEAEAEGGTGLKALGAALAFSTGALGAGYAVARAGSAGLAASAEKLELRTSTLIIAALGEAIAIYGIVVALLVLGST